MIFKANVRFSSPFAYKEISVHFLFNNTYMHLLRFAKQKMLNNLWSLYLKGFFIYLLIDLIFIVTFVLQNKTYAK